jgi:sugar lactone lactonase YvrE
VDSTGNIYATDDHSAIRKITPAGVVTTLAGSSPAIGPTPGFVDGLGGAARFAGPWGMAIDAAGNLFVADAFNYAIRKVTPAGQVTTLAGAQPAAQGYVDATGNAARFKSPDTVSIDAAGNLYVNDANGSAVRKVTPGGVVTTVAYTDSFTATTGQPAPTGALHIASFPYVTFVANSAGVLYFPIGCAIEKAGP